MTDIFIDYPLILLFVVASIGYLIGNIKIKGISLGVSAILFVGLIFGTIDSRYNIPDIIFLLGLSIFVYSVGLGSGPAFFRSYKKNGIKDFIFIISFLSLSAIISVGLWYAFGFSAATISGAYAGSTTNSPAMAGILDIINNKPDLAAPNALNDTVIGFSYSYPMGVIGGFIGIIVLEKLFKIDYKKEEAKLKDEYPIEEKLLSKSICITNPEIDGLDMRQLFKKYNWNVTVARLFSNNEISLANWSTKFHLGDIIVVVGSLEALDIVAHTMGKYSDSKMAYNREKFTSRRIFVSNNKIIGRTIASLDLEQKFNIVITRLRRGDIDMIAKGNIILEQGDRIRYIADRDDVEKINEYFGDSYHASSRVDLFSFGLGIGIGLLIGSINISLGNNISFKLGYAGGPLVVGLILGALRRIGPINWTLPYSANVTLKQIGLILLLSSIGVSAGHAFSKSLSMESLKIILASAAISLITAFAILYIGYKWMNKSFIILMGMVSNQPAILEFAISRAKSNIPSFGYSMIFPIAIIFKIVITQLMYLFLSSF